MTDNFEKLKNEISVLYPGIKDIELTKATENLINFFAKGVKSIYEVKKSD